MSIGPEVPNILPSRPVKPFEQLSPRSKRRIMADYRILQSRYPDYTLDQYLAERQAGRVAPTSRFIERRIPESIKQRPQGQYALYPTEELGELAYQSLYEKVGPGSPGGIRPGSVERILQAQTVEEINATSASGGALFGGWNDQAVRFNIAQLVASDNRAALIDLITADEDTIRYNAHVAGSIAAKGGSVRSPWWFYKGDIFQAVAA